MKRGISMLILGLAAGAASLTAQAVHAQCVIFDPVVLSGSFDPFNPSGTTVQTVTITARRPPAVGGKKTQEVNFIYLRRPDTPASLAIVQTSTGGQILENPPGHVLDPNNTNPNEVELNFGGVGQPDVQTFVVTITVPSGADLAAGTTDLFVDQKYLLQAHGRGGRRVRRDPQLAGHSHQRAQRPAGQLRRPRPRLRRDRRADDRRPALDPQFGQAADGQCAGGQLRALFGGPDLGQPVPDDLSRRQPGHRQPAHSLPAGLPGPDQDHRLADLQHGDVPAGRPQRPVSGRKPHPCWKAARARLPRPTTRIS
jgi:hypothetical protein